MFKGQPIGLNSQFRFCGNPLRVDTYKGCDFGCKYCFANSRNGAFKLNRNSWDEIDYNILENQFKKAFESDKEYKDINVELMKHRVPLHLGGMSEPFQNRENELKLTYKLIELTNKYNYPMMISTKVAHLDEEYFKILNPSIHAFQISLISPNDDYIRKYETHTPSATERIAFIKELYNRNFWVGLRIQPLIDIQEAIDLTNILNLYINYITIEHLKIPTDNTLIKNALIEEKNRFPYYKPKKSRSWEMETQFKYENIKKIKEIASVPVGCGDNDLHQFSESRCCCGLDTINENFDTYLKYNASYLRSGEVEDGVWIPSSSCKKALNSESILKDKDNIKDYVDYYMENTKDWDK